MPTELHKRFRRDSQSPIDQNINVARPSPKPNANIPTHACTLLTSAESDRASLYEPSNKKSSDSDDDEEEPCLAPTSPVHSADIAPRSWRPRPTQRIHAARTAPSYIDLDDEPLATRRFGAGKTTSRLNYGDTDDEPLARRRSVLGPTKEGDMLRSANALTNKSTAAWVDSDQNLVERDGSHPLPPNPSPKADQAPGNTLSSSCSIPIFIITTLADVKPSTPDRDPHAGAGAGTGYIIFKPSVEK